MARALGLLFVAGALVCISWLLLPHGQTRGDRWVLGAAISAVVVGFGLLAGAADGWPKSRFHFLIGFVQVLITMAFIGKHEPDTLLLFFYLWVTPYTALFFGRRASIAHTIAVSILLAAALRFISAPFGRAAGIWIITIGTVLAVGTLVGSVAGTMRSRDQELWHQATHDLLTGLPNRRTFAERTVDAIATRAPGETVAVLLIDLDRFKVINDTHGHQAGDDLLSQLAPRLRALVREGDWVSRFGGDEFAILVRRAGRFNAQTLADRIAEAWQRPLETSEGPLFTSGCVGIAVASRADDTPQRLLRDADSALYRAKAIGPNNFQVFDEAMRDGAEHRLRLEQGLREAIDGEQFHLVYQPVVELRTGEMSSVEVLLRWTHPELGTIPPDAFIPLAEESGLIAPIGQWVIEQTVLQLAAWRSAFQVPPGFAAAVNVSSTQLRDGFAASVARILRLQDVPAEALVVELTESAVIDVSRETTREIQRLRDLGIRLVLDDFGTGYSSLSYLQNIPLDGLKIDRSFIARISETTDAPIVEAIITLARTLGLGTVAEGIETTAQRDRLRDMGCDRGQGYLFARPACAPEIETHFEAAHLAS